MLLASRPAERRTIRACYRFPPRRTRDLLDLESAATLAPAGQRGSAEPVGLAASGPAQVDINTASADDLNGLGGRFAGSPPSDVGLMGQSTNSCRSGF